MRESLREVSQGVAAMPGVFRVEANMVGKAERRSKISLARGPRGHSKFFLIPRHINDLGDMLDSDIARLRASPLAGKAQA